MTTKPSFHRLYRLELNKRGMQKLEKLKSSGMYAEHQYIWNCFRYTKKTERDFLFARMIRPEGEKAHFLVQAPTSPRFFPNQGQKFRVEVPYMEVQKTFKFSTQVHATRSRASASGGRGVRMPLMAYEAFRARKENEEVSPLERVVEDWLNQQGEGAASFEVTSCQAYQREGVRPSGHRFLLDLYHVEGHLTITSLYPFMKMWHTGLGRAKSMGAGLLHLEDI
jgi:CRISPR-associated protein Cas6/Cse3/CasE subtype I-E